MFVKVILNTSVTELDKLFTYKVPNNMIEKIAIGKRVAVPFSVSNRKEIGIILEIANTIDFDAKLAKDIIEVIDSEPLVSDFNIKLSKWISKRYICNLSNSLRLMFPPDIARKQKRLRASKKEKNVYLNVECPLLEYYEDIEGITPKRKEVLEFLINTKCILLSDLLEYFNTSKAFLKWFIDKKIIEIKEDIIKEDVFAKYNIDNEQNQKKILLSKEQEAICDQLLKLIHLNTYQQALIHGITGSGKTEVYMNTIEQVLNSNKNAIVLVPEISLTPQMANRFISRFGNVVSVLHSKLSFGQRIDEYTKIRNGNIKIIIGPRSAIFAPLSNIGIIVIDEEHDLSYKSETTPKYSTIEVAQKICQYNNCLLLLGSATPSILSYYKAQIGDMHLLELKNRTNNSVLPNIEIVDMINSTFINDSKTITQRLYDEIKINLERKEQSIVFLNKRGYCSSIVCKECGFVYKCPKCNVSLTYHKDKRKLLCHYCGYSQHLDKSCKLCGNTELTTNVIGTQKIEQELQKLFPNASIIRMDHDTTIKKDSYIDIINKFKNDNIDILIGTQMIAKGHDFPNVTLVGIINADMMLYLQDYKCNELTYNLLTQVSGRAGRNGNDGRVILQTYQKDNSIFSYIKANDYSEFYQEEIRYRNTLLFPPFCDIIQIVFIGEQEEKVFEISKQVFEYLKKSFLEFANLNQLMIFPPVQALLSKIDNKYRYKINIKCKYSVGIADKLRKMTIDNNKKFKDVRMDIEINSTMNI